VQHRQKEAQVQLLPSVKWQIHENLHCGREGGREHSRQVGKYLKDMKKKKGIVRAEVHGGFQEAAARDRFVGEGKNSLGWFTLGGKGKNSPPG